MSNTLIDTHVATLIWHVYQRNADHYHDVFNQVVNACQPSLFMIDIFDETEKNILCTELENTNKQLCQALPIEQQNQWTQTWRISMTPYVDSIRKLGDELYLSREHHHAVDNLDWVNLGSNIDNLTWLTDYKTLQSIWQLCLTLNQHYNVLTRKEA